MKTDFTVKTTASIVFLTPTSERAKVWIDNNLELEDWQRSDQIPIEPRMFQDIRAGIILAGMKFEYT